MSAFDHLASIVSMPKVRSANPSGPVSLRGLCPRSVEPLRDGSYPQKI